MKLLRTILALIRSGRAQGGEVRPSTQTGPRGIVDPGGPWEPRRHP